MYEFISGAIAVACLVVGLFFTQFYKKLGDRFFLIFAISFNLLAFERFILIFLDVKNDNNIYVYYIRLVAFVLILMAIADKNRKTT